jgi:hypothetical protein
MAEDPLVELPERPAVPASETYWQARKIVSGHALTAGSGDLDSLIKECADDGIADVSSRANNHCFHC